MLMFTIKAKKIVIYATQYIQIAIQMVFKKQTDTHGSLRQPKIGENKVLRKQT